METVTLSILELKRILHCFEDNSNKADILDSNITQKLNLALENQMKRQNMLIFISKLKQKKLQDHFHLPDEVLTWDIEYYFSFYEGKEYRRVANCLQRNHVFSVSDLMSLNIEELSKLSYIGNSGKMVILNTLHIFSLNIHKDRGNEPYIQDYRSCTQ